MVLLHQFGHPRVVGRGQLDRNEVTVSEGAEEERFDPGACLGAEQVADLGDDGGGQE